MKQSEYQIDGNHYEGSNQWWDLSTDMQIANPLIHTALKYIDRYGKKESVRPITVDLKKAIHYIKKYQELVKEKRITRFSRCYYNPKIPMLRRGVYLRARKNFIDKIREDAEILSMQFLATREEIKYKYELSILKDMEYHIAGVDVFDKQRWEEQASDYRFRIYRAVNHILQGELSDGVYHLNRCHDQWENYHRMRDMML